MLNNLPFIPSRYENATRVAPCNSSNFTPYFSATYGNNFNKKIVSQNFSRAAKNYDSNAQTQYLAAQKLCQLALSYIKNDAKILDLGAGSGFVSNNLSASKNKVSIFESDLSFEMLKQKRASNDIFQIQSDFENLPFKNHSFDILISSFSLQWLNDFEKNFSQFSSLLKPQGFFIFCLPTADSLQELTLASASSNCNFNFNNLPEINYLKSILEKCGFAQNLCESEVLKSEFDSGIAALKSIKKTGANYLIKKKPVSKTQLESFDSFCLKNFCSLSKKISISWNVSYFIYQKF